MRPIWAIIGATSLMVMSAPEVEAQTTTCADLNFSAELLSRFPGADAACLDVVEKNGQPYAKFNAELVSATNSRVRVRFDKPDGTKTDIYTFQPGSNARVNIGGRNYRYRELSAGQSMHIYLPPDRFEIVTHEDEMADFAATTAAVSTVAVMDDPEPEPASSMSSLPKTAGLLPLLGLAGALLLSLGGMVRFVRRRF